MHFTKFGLVHTHTPPPPPQKFRPLSGHLGRWFSVCNLSSTPLVDWCKKDMVIFSMGFLPTFSYKSLKFIYYFKMLYSFSKLYFQSNKTEIVPYMSLNIFEWCLMKMVIWLWLYNSYKLENFPKILNLSLFSIFGPGICTDHC